MAVSPQLRYPLWLMSAGVTADNSRQTWGTSVVIDVPHAAEDIFSRTLFYIQKVVAGHISEGLLEMCGT